MAKTLCGYRITRTTERGYQFLYIEVRVGHVADAARQYKTDGTQSALNRLQRVREKTGDTLYFAETYGHDGFTLKWQTHLEERREDVNRPAQWFPWYAGRVDASDLRAAEITLLGKIVKSAEDDRDMSPETVMTALATIGAVYIRHDSEFWHGEWLIDRDIDALAKIVIEQPEQLQTV